MTGLLIYLLCIIVEVAVSQTFYVTPNPQAGADCSQTNPCSLETALTNASGNGQADTIILEGGTYSLSTTLDYSSQEDLTISAADPNNLPVIDGQGSLTLMEIVATNSSVTISNLKFYNAGVSQNKNFSALKIEAGNISLENTIFENNSADYNNYILYLSGNNINLDSNSFINNTINTPVNISPAIAHMFYIKATNNVNFSNNVLDNNTSRISMNILNIEGKEVNVNGNKFINNKIDDYSASIVLGNLVYIIGENIYIYNNEAYNNTLLNPSDISVSAHFLISYSDYMDFTGNVIKNAPNLSGLIANLIPFTNTITIANISSNKFIKMGGGDSAGCINVEGTLVYIRKNLCYGVVSSSGTINTVAGGYYATFIEITNNILAYNNSSYMGGGIYIKILGGSPLIDIVNNTIYRNKAGYGGGITIEVSDNRTGAVVNIFNNIIYENEAQEGYDLFVFNQYNVWGEGFVPKISIYNNLLTDASAVNNPMGGIILIDPFYPNRYFHGNNIEGDIVFLDERNLNFYPIPGSPVIDNGSEIAPSLPAEDFEGKSRVLGNGVDIGAVEFDPDLPVSIPDMEVMPSGIISEKGFVGKEKEKVIKILNVGNADLIIDSISVEGNFISLSYEGLKDPCGQDVFSLKPGQSCSIGIKMFADNKGVYEGRVYIYSNDPVFSVYELAVRFEVNEWYDSLNLKTVGGTLKLEIEGGFFGKVEEKSLPCNIPEGYKTSAYGTFLLDVDIMNGIEEAVLKVNFPGDLNNLILFLCKVENKKGMILAEGEVEVKGRTLSFKITDSIDGNKDGKAVFYMGIFEQDKITFIVKREKGCRNTNGLYLLGLFIITVFLRRFGYNFNK